jgi:hypothetical protein
MKKVLLTLLAVVLILGLLGTAGFAGYRFGYMRGVQTTAKAVTPNGNPNPQPRPFDNFDRRGMPMRNSGDDFGRGFHRGFGFGGFPMMGMGFGLFGLFGFLIRIAVFALIIWFIYWLFTRSGWRLTRQPVESAPPTVETKAGNSENE